MIFFCKRGYIFNPDPTGEGGQIFRKIETIQITIKKIKPSYQKAKSKLAKFETHL